MKEQDLIDLGFERTDVKQLIEIIKRNTHTRK
jgi:hypothetical protein